MGDDALKTQMLVDEVVNETLRAIPEAIRTALLLELMDGTHDGRRAVLAGGAIRDTVTGTPVKDFDVFCLSQGHALTLSRSFAAATGASAPVQTLNAYTVTVDGVPVQFVFYRAFLSPEDLVSQFDFRACAAAVYFDRGWKGVCLNGFLEDCKAKRLTFLHQRKDAGSLVPLRRALKLAEKGWRLPDEGVAGILEHWTPVLKLKAKSTRRSLKPSGYAGRR